MNIVSWANCLNSYRQQVFVVLNNNKIDRDYMNSVNKLLKSTKRSQSEDFLLSGGTVHLIGDR